jgi:hypothetical protein
MYITGQTGHLTVDFLILCLLIRVLSPCITHRGGYGPWATRAMALGVAQKIS